MAAISCLLEQVFFSIAIINILQQIKIKIITLWILNYMRRKEITNFILFSWALLDNGGRLLLSFADDLNAD